MMTGQDAGAAGRGEGDPDGEGHKAEPEMVLPAVREGRLWVVLAPQQGVLVYGRTLRELAESAQNAVALRDGTAGTVVRVRPTSAELDALAEVRAPYEQALSEAVRSLRLNRVIWSDIASACQVRAAEARARLP